MRHRVFPLLAACLAAVGCRPPSVEVPRLVPDTIAWHARSPLEESARRYAAALNRLNSSSRGDFDAADGLTLEEAESVALIFNPDLRVARLEARVPLVGASQSGVPDDPRLQFDALRVLQSVSSPWVLATGIGFTIPLSGRLAAERVRAFAEADAALRAALVSEWSLVVRLREAWIEWSATEHRIALLEAYLSQLDEILLAARAQRAAGQIDATELRVLDLEQVSRAGELVVLRAQQVRRVLDLKALMGLSPSAEVELVPGFPEDPADVAWESETARLTSANLELALAQAEYVAAERALRHEVSQRFPDIEVGPLFESEEGIEKLGAGVGIPLPLWNRNRRAIAEACARRAAARAAYQAKYETLASALARARADHDAATTRGAWLTDRVAPLADQQLTDVRRLGELGDLEVLILKDALSAALDAKLEILDARRERATASNRRRALTEPLWTPMAAAHSERK